MHIIYRACPVGNPKNKVIQQKHDLVSTCFNSLIQAFKGCQYNLLVIVDKPNKEFLNIFKGFEVVETYFGDLVDGNIGTFHKQIDLALEKDESFLFVEDDYFFLPNTGQYIIDALNVLPFLTPYDHPDHYNFLDPYKRDVKLINNRHWLSVCSTTLTFGGQHEYLAKYSELIKSYGTGDHPMWLDITKETPLYCAIPSIATHMESEVIAPGMRNAWLQTH